MLRDERDDVGDGDVDISSDDGDHGADNKKSKIESHPSVRATVPVVGAV